MDKFEKDKHLLDLKELTIPSNYVSPAGSNNVVPVSYENALLIMSKPWISGFIEGEGSFYLVTKDSNRIVHGFGISQKLDLIVLDSINTLLYIKT